MRIWAEHFAASDTGRQQLCVVVVRKAGRAVLVMPLAVSPHPGLALARMAGDPIAQSPRRSLTNSSDDIEAAFNAALSELTAAGIDAIVLRRVRAEFARSAQLAGPLLRQAAAASAAPYADLAPYADYDDFLKSLSKNMRKGLRNRRMHLAKAGDVSLRYSVGEQPPRRALQAPWILKRRWLVHRGAVSSAFLDHSTRDCLLDLAEDRSGSGATVLRLLVNGEPAAIRFGFEYNGTHFAYLSAYDQRFGNLSPGRLLMDFCISGARERGLTTIDMLPPPGRHKTEWCASNAGRRLHAAAQRPRPRLCEALSGGAAPCPAMGVVAHALQHPLAGGRHPRSGFRGNPRERAGHGPRLVLLHGGIARAPKRRNRRKDEEAAERHDQEGQRQRPRDEHAGVAVREHQRAAKFSSSIGPSTKAEHQRRRLAADLRRRSRASRRRGEVDVEGALLTRIDADAAEQRG